MKRLKLTGPRSLWSDRHLTLPMSPITKPSALEFQEASCDPELSSIFAARHVPRVSTQKRLHLTGLSPALPQMIRPSHKRESLDSQLPRAGEQSPLWTESVFPVGREDPEQIGNLSMASSFITNSLGPKKRSSRREEESERKRIEWPRKPPVIDWPGRPPVRGKFVRREQHKMSGLGVLDRKTKRKPLIAEKSFDHEVIMAKEKQALISLVFRPLSISGIIHRKWSWKAQERSCQRQRQLYWISMPMKTL